MDHTGNIADPSERKVYGRRSAAKNIYSKFFRGEAEKKYKRLGTSEQDVALARLRHDTRRLATKVTEYVETTSEPMTGFDTNLLDQVVAFYNEVLSLSGYISASIRTDADQPGNSGNDSA